MKWIKFDPDAYLAGVVDCTPEERGIYDTVWATLYSRNLNIPPPDDERYWSRACCCDRRTWRRVRDQLMAKGKLYVEVDGKMMAKRVRDEWERSTRRIKDMVELRAKQTQKQQPAPDAASNGAARKATTTSTGGPAPPQAEGGAPLGDCGTSARKEPRSFATASNGDALARSEARSPDPDKPAPEDIAERRRRVQQELAEMTDAEVTEWCKTRGPNGADHNEKLRSTNGGLRYKNGLGG